MRLTSAQRVALGALIERSIIPRARELAVLERLELVEWRREPYSIVSAPRATAKGREAFVEATNARAADYWNSQGARMLLEELAADGLGDAVAIRRAINAGAEHDVRTFRVALAALDLEDCSEDFTTPPDAEQNAETT